MTSKLRADQHLDLDRGLPVTQEDIAVQRRLRLESRSWLELDWRELDAMLPPNAPDRRLVARDSWAPFSLD